MKKLTAFFTAFILFLCTALGIHCSLNSWVPPSSFGTWASETKTKAWKGVQKSLNKNSLLVFGSSEFMHGRNTPYHPTSMFYGTDCEPMLLGAGYYQSLSHAIALSALAQEKPKPEKAVLILSPQWFRKTGVLPEAFASRFSESNYIGMLKNPELSSKTKHYMEKRVSDLLDCSPRMQNWISSYNKVWDSKTACESEKFSAHTKEAFLEERERVALPLLYGWDFRSDKPIPLNKTFPRKGASPDFSAYKKQAETDGAREQQNPFFMDQKSFQRLQPVLKKKKGISKNAVNGYQNSPEYQDLECFLQVCQELCIKPLLVILPVNGYYYDYTEFPKEARQGYYKKILKTTEQFQVQTADFSGEEYTRYFFEDQVHLGRKGWVMVNESIYNYFKENNTLL